MIRLNLLEETRVAPKKGGGGGSPFGGMEIQANLGIAIMLLGILSAVGVVGVLWMLNAGKISGLESDIDKAKKEKAKLEYVLEQNEELHRREKELKRKIDIIFGLKANQDRPVVMMSEMSKNVESAENVWFTDLTFTGNSLKLKGKALTKLQYTKLLQNLEASGYFDQVASGTMTEHKDDTVSWTLDLVFVGTGTAPNTSGTAAGSRGKTKRTTGQAPNTGAKN